MNNLTKTIVWATALILPISAVGQTVAPHNSYQYSWSGSATMIVEATITAKRVVDSEEKAAPYTIVRLGINNVQRGSPESTAINVVIDDEIQLLRGDKRAFEIGARGTWYLNRVRPTDGGIERAELLRYINSREMDSDPNFTRELGRWVIQDTVSKSIERDFLSRIESTSNQEEVAVTLSLEYDIGGKLIDIQVSEKSGNRIFDEHVFDAAIAVHRTTRYPQNVGENSIKISRTVR